ncbi:MAG: NAD-glutamate dehydrogenase, partial [Holophagales bacterium]|nr:NAD-glutamate dehydrogenase [Holophagales bacterium]
KRHFRELQIDSQKQPFTCVAVGDMSGDVFGNGMLQSEHTRLVAAFNHLHIFVDPDPPTAEAFVERKRLFELERSSWTDYDRSLLSGGGEIFERSAKSLTVSPQVKERFSLSAETLTPNELIQAILRAKVDLVWFGGIGTYVRAESESHGEVGDRQNDEVRVYASELGARVIGEGANLGLTQRGRIEFALGGGRANTDFIDNSGGVSCSDHEVNIKIALRDAVLTGALPQDERDRLLASMTDEVARLVLRDNYLQSQAITLEESQALALLEDQARLMRNLERAGNLDRRLEFLPDDSTLAERKRAKKGLTRPEISVLFAYSKIQVYNELLDSSLPDEPQLVRDLRRYFPKPMRKAYRQPIEDHRLRREIIATHVTNSLVNRLGTTFVTRLQEETGRRVSDVARAYLAARDVFEIRSLWSQIEALDNKVTADHQVNMLHIITRMMGEVTRWFLRHGGHPLDMASCLEQYENDMVVVAAQLEELLPPTAKSRVRRRQKRLRELGVPDGLAVPVSSMDILPSVCDVALCTRESDMPVERVGKIYFAVGESLSFDRFRRAALQLAREGPYAQQAVT